MEFNEPNEVETDGAERRLSLGRKIANWLHRLNVGRYEEIVPQEVREAMENEGIPKPNSYAP